MSSPELPADDPMLGSGNEDEGDGDAIMPGVSDDSSEEEEENEEEEQRIRDGFIVDEDEDEEEDDLPEERERKKSRKRRKRHHRREEDDGLEDDDLALLEENTGTSFKRRGRLTRLRRGRDSESPPAASTSKRRAVIDSSDDDLDHDDLPRVQDIHNIWDDDGGRGDEDDIDSFIESDDEEGGAVLDEKAREERRREKKKQDVERRRTQKAHPELAGIDANAWDEIHEVFGDGHMYDWALEKDDEVPEDEHQTRMDEVFEPTDIQNRFLTLDDDNIRAYDIPERMQLATSSLSSSSGLSRHQDLTRSDIDGAALWVTSRLSVRTATEYFSPAGVHQHLKAELVLAVTFVIKQLFLEMLEVPYLWAHRRDYITYADPDTGRRTELLTQDELWRIHTLGLKYRSLVARRQTLATSYDRLGVQDAYYEEEVQPQIETVEMVADATEWLHMRYKDKRNTEQEFRFHDDEEPEARRHKMPSRISAYEVAKNSIVSQLAQGFGIQTHQVVMNFFAMQHVHFIDNPELNPIAYAERFADPDPEKAQSPENLLAKARMILASELGKDPLLRHHVRDLFKEDAHISIVPTQRGIVKIDEFHPYFNFKYLHFKRVKSMLADPQFLNILAAEKELLVTVEITLDTESKANLERRLNDAFASDGFSDPVKRWNEERSRVVQEVLEQHLLPAGVKWTREYLREEVEDWGAARIGDLLRQRIDVAPYNDGKLLPGETPTVVAMSWGKGDPQKDAISMVYVQDQGNMRETVKIDNLVDTETRDEFVDFIRRRKPHVIVVGGFTMSTTKLMSRIREILATAGGPEGGGGWDERELASIPVIYVNDQVARIYQHSKRAADEYTALSTTAKYCVGLARFTQNPLLEYAALGSDIQAITFDEDIQHLIPQDKVFAAFERALVDVTNKVGVDINRSVLDGYYQHLLRFVCGLGPRKAEAMLKRISDVGGNVINRQQFIRSGLLSTNVFLNAIPFLRITQDEQEKSHSRGASEPDQPDPLDDTRIHPEDYELARKMATDALELDEEDVHGEHPSSVITAIMRDPDGEKKLNDLNLDEFAISLYESNEDKKRFTLTMIREELCKPFADRRPPLQELDNWAVLTMLSGESEKTLKPGLLVSVVVQRVNREGLAVRLDSGLDGVVPAEGPGGQNLMFEGTKPHFTKNQTIRVVVHSVDISPDATLFQVTLSARPSDTAVGSEFMHVSRDDAWDLQRYDKDLEMQQRKKRAEVNKSRRIIKHPNFHNFNTAQAETYLDKQQRGDVIIRPSSKGLNHLAVTWKVEDGLYQHIDVIDAQPDETGQSVGTLLVVDATHHYADLDELIVNHVQAMARRVEELVAHERFKTGSEDDLHLWLKNRLKADPGKSMYGFTLNRKRPGHFSLCFLANKESKVQTWPVRVTPEAYYLFEAAAVGVPELCDAFKVRHLHQSQNVANAAAGGRTPYGAGGRTPRAGVTPGHASVRQGGRTPNPYGGATPRPPGYGGATPRPSAYPSTYPTTYAAVPAAVPYPAASALPRGMNPERAAMINSNAASQSAGGGGWSGTSWS